MSTPDGTYLKQGALHERVQTIVSAAGTTVLVAGSPTNTRITGATTQIVRLPDATTLKNGRFFYIGNRSSGVVTIQFSDATTAITLAADVQTKLRLINNSTAVGSWDVTNEAGTGGGGGDLEPLYDAIVDAASGGTHTTIQAAINAVSSGDRILIVPATYTETITHNKTLVIDGKSHGVIIDGTYTITTEDFSAISLVKFNDDVTINTDKNFLFRCWIASGKTITDNGTDNAIIAIEE